MVWHDARVTLEVYEAELEPLVRVVQMDCDGDEASVSLIVFSPVPDKLQLSPAELLRRGLNQEAYEAARTNFEKLRRKEPPQLMRSQRLHQRRSKSPTRAS